MNALKILIVDDEPIARDNLEHIISKDGYQVLKQKTSLPPLRKLWLALKTWFKY